MAQRHIPIVVLRVGCAKDAGCQGRFKAWAFIRREKGLIEGLIELLFLREGERVEIITVSVLVFARVGAGVSAGLGLRGVEDRSLHIIITIRGVRDVECRRVGEGLRLGMRLGARPPMGGHEWRRKKCCGAKVRIGVDICENIDALSSGTYPGPSGFSD